MSGFRVSGLCSYFLIFIINYSLINDSIKQVFCKHSGLYADNGYQTVLHPVTRREKRQLRDDLLAFLDLPDIPKPRKRQNEPLFKNSASEFLIDVYKNALSDSNDDDDSENFINQYDFSKDFDFNLTGRDLRAINDSDVIMSFGSHYRHFSVGNHKRGKALWFDVTKVPSSEELTSAELRIYRSLKIKQKKIPKSFVITVYRISKTHQGKKELKFVSSLNKTSNKQSWLTLNVTEALQHWVYHPEDNQGLYLSVHPADQPDFEIPPKDVGIVGHSGSIKKQPFLVGFFKNSELLTNKKRQKRDSTNKIRKKKSDSSIVDYRNMFVVEKDEPIDIYTPKSCRLLTFHVNFRDLGIHDVVIAPDGFDARYCAGDCNFPLNSHMNATNHAVVQTLVNLLQPTEHHTPKACCAPTQLISTKVLFAEGNTVVFKRFNNMIATSCACQ